MEDYDEFCSHFKIIDLADNDELLFLELEESGKILRINISKLV